MSQIDLPRRHHLDAITSERWTASDQNRWTPSVRYDRTASLESALQVHISAIRKALGQDRAILQTASGRGYRLLGRWSTKQGEASEGPVDLLPAQAAAEPVQSNLPAVPAELIGRAAAVHRVLAPVLEAGQDPLGLPEGAQGRAAAGQRRRMAGVDAVFRISRPASRSGSPGRRLDACWTTNPGCVPKFSSG